MEQRITIDYNSFFFNNVFTPVCKQMHHPKTDVTIVVVNKERSQKNRREVKEKYKFIFDYPEDNDEIVGVEVFHLGEVI